MRWKSREPGFIAGLAFLVASHVFSGVVLAQDGTDWVTKFPREPAQVSTWPGGKRLPSASLYLSRYSASARARSSARDWQPAIPTS